MHDDSWTRVHDLALVYIALAYGTDYDLTDAELTRITDTLRTWQPEAELSHTQETVMEAMSVYLSDDAALEVAHAIESLGKTLDEAERGRALEDIVRIAEADGILLTSERGLISLLASVWGLRAAGQRLLDASEARTEESRPWNLLHDISLMYLILAHSTDAELHEAEITAMLERLHDWRPDLSEDELRRILRETLEVYASQPDEAFFGRAVSSIRNRMTIIQRLVLLDDLVHIAEVDGQLTPREKEMIGTLATAWQVGIRLNGHALRAKAS